MKKKFIPVTEILGSNTENSVSGPAQRYCEMAKTKSKQPLTGLAFRVITEKYKLAKLALV